jgi:predicted transcriptional regulator
MQKMKHTQTMSSTMATTRKIDDLMNQMEETFSQRLLRMIDERRMTDSEVYSRAHVDRRHFSKIRKDVNYNPNKKTVLAFAIALELSLDETKDLLNSAGFALSRSSKTDIIVAYFLQNKIYDMFEINDILDAYEQPIFE